MKITRGLLHKMLPHFTAIVVFITVNAIYFSPQLKGYLLEQGDYNQYLGMSKEITDFRDQYDTEPLWTNAMFGGMPAYQISTENSNPINSLKNLILEIMPRPMGYMFFLMIGFYILLLCFNINPWLAIIGSIAYGLSSVNILFLMAGHNSKVHAISFIPPLVGGIVYAYRKNFLIGGVLVSIFTCLHLSANHVQMTYYLLYLVAAIVIVEFYIYLKNNAVPKFFKVSAFLIVAGGIGILPPVSNLLVTYEYGQHTTRGKSELTISADNTSSNDSQNDALSSDYIRQYSLGFGEIWSLAIPNVKGGPSGALGQNQEIMREVSPNYRNFMAQYSSYWGEQYFTGGAFYFGASVFLLFILSMLFVKDKIKWALLAVSVLAILLSWKYSSVLDVFIAHVPLFNKFRDTKMMLILVQLSFPLLGFLFLNNLLKNGIDRKRFLYISLSVSGIILMFYLLPTVWFDFLNREENQQFNNQLATYQNNPDALRQLDELKEEIIHARIAIFREDCLRSLFFVVATAFVIYLFMMHKLKSYAFITILGGLILIDLWGVDKRYLNNDKNGRAYNQWVSSYEYYNPYQAEVADLEILKYETESKPSLQQKVDHAVDQLQPDRKLKPAERQIEQEKVMFRELNFATNYRVFSLLDPFDNSRTSYYHKSIGGYHGAKLKRYQEIINFYLREEYQNIVNVISSKPTNEDILTLLRRDIPILNMLNTKYIIYNLAAPPIVNPYHYGNAWFVDNITYVENADQEILALDSINNRTAILHEKYKNQISQNVIYDSSATIQLISYKPNHLTYETKTQNNQLAVFSEIFYEDGWNAYLDGEKTEYFKANYFLRAVNIPEGKHVIEFKFEPDSYYLGKRISYAGSGLIILFVLGCVFYECRNRRIFNHQ